MVYGIEYLITKMGLSIGYMNSRVIFVYCGRLSINLFRIISLVNVSTSFSFLFGSSHFVGSPSFHPVIMVRIRTDPSSLSSMVPRYRRLQECRPRHRTDRYVTPPRSSYVSIWRGEGRIVNRGLLCCRTNVWSLFYTIVLFNLKFFSWS